MRHLIITTFIVILAGAQCCISGEMSEKMKQITESCFAKAEVSQEEQKRLIDAKFIVDDPEPSTLCFAKCVMEECGVLKDGGLDEEAVMAIFGPVLGTEKLADIVEKCKDEQGDAECETEFKIFTCFHRQANNIFQ